MQEVESSRALPRFVVLYAAMYCAFGVASPLLPALVMSRGLPAEQLGLVLAAGMGVRMISAPLAGRIGDALGALRLVYVVSATLAALVVLGYLSAKGFLPLLVLSLAHAAALAPITVLADALAVGAASSSPRAHGKGVEYGWVRGVGSAAFVAGTLCSAQAVRAFGLDAIVPLQAMLLAASAVAAMFVPELSKEDRRARAGGEPLARGVLRLLRDPTFARVVLIAALVLGSHAMHDAFAMIRWRRAGIGPTMTSVLWSESVVAEVIMFFVFGPLVLSRFRPAVALAAAATAGALRWSVTALTANVVVLALVQPLHGVTFALLHLACMRLIGAMVPHGLEGTAQAIYGTVAVGGANAILTLASGALYGRVDARGFLVMAALSAASLPMIWSLRHVRIPLNGSATRPSNHALGALRDAKA